MSSNSDLSVSVRVLLEKKNRDFPRKGPLRGPRRLYEKVPKGLTDRWVWVPLDYKDRRGYPEKIRKMGEGRTEDPRTNRER